MFLLFQGGNKFSNKTERPNQKLIRSTSIKMELLFIERHQKGAKRQVRKGIHNS